MNPVILLSDNGSKRPQSALQLRALANRLSDQTGHRIHPVSLQHANAIPAEELDGEPAQIFREFMADQLAQGQREFVVLPLFFGNSKAVSKFIPEEVAALQQEYGEFSLRVAEVIYPLPEGEPQLADIILDHMQQTANSSNLPLSNAVLVDHGSPSPRVTAVRNHLAEQVRHKLDEQTTLSEAVMERREGKEYDFNGDLLDDWLRQQARAGASSAIVAMMFFLPGRHAGPGGDVADICQSVMDDFPGFQVAITPLIAEHPDFLAILAARLDACLS